ncbi:unnamed protein product [Rhodiola kirilowii]
MIPSCFSNPNTVAGSSNSSQSPQNLTTSTYQAQLFSSLTSAGYVTLTWSKSQYSHSLTIYVPEALTISISLVLPALSIFNSRRGSGSKSFYLSNNDGQKVKVLWDFGKAKFSQSCAAPESGYYVAFLCNGKLHFFLGDLKEELIKRVGSIHLKCHSAEAALVSRREHVFGHRSYKSRVEFLGLHRDILIECYNGLLKVKVDGKTCLVVKRLAWKFRGNERIFIGGAQVQFYWDVFNWVNTAAEHRDGHGLFMFLVGDGGAWPEMVGPEKKLMKKKSFSMTPPPPQASLSPMQSCSSVLQWAEDSSDICRSSSSSSSSNMSSAGFSLLMYAWRKD